VLLGAMSEEELRRAITEPARLAGLKLENGLVDLIIRDIAGEPGALPLLSHALHATWERRDGRTLTIEVSLRKQHYIQACAHLSILTYWGWYWHQVYDAVPRIAAECCRSVRQPQ
jgi:hypothetical protein